MPRKIGQNYAKGGRSEEDVMYALFYIYFLVYEKTESLGLIYDNMKYNLGFILKRFSASKEKLEDGVIMELSFFYPKGKFLYI